MPRQWGGVPLAALIMALSKGQKITTYAIGVLIGCLILMVIPRKGPRELHPWHEQTAPHGYYPLSFTDDFGREIEFERQPRWFVSLAPSITEMLFAMDMGDHILAVTEWDEYPEKAKALRDAGSSVGRIDQPDLEIIAGLRPDLVIASNLTPIAVLGRIEEGTHTRAVSLHHDTFEDVIADIGKIGRITGVPARALRLMRSMETKRDQVLEQLEPIRGMEARRTLFLLHIEDGLLPGWSPGSGTWIGDMIEMIHGENIAARLGSSWGQLSLEAVVDLDPEVIFVKDGATAGSQQRLRARAEALSAHPVWSQITAVREGRVVLVDNGPFSIPGPRMVDALQTLAQALWPEIEFSFEPSSTEEEVETD